MRADKILVLYEGKVRGAGNSIQSWSEPHRALYR